MTKNGRPIGVAPASKHLRDVRMIHHRQRLPLLLEARDHLLRVHPQLDDLQRHAPPHRLLLLRHPDHAEAALADLLEQLVRPDLLADSSGLSRAIRSSTLRGRACSGTASRDCESSGAGPKAPRPTHVGQSPSRESCDRSLPHSGQRFCVGMGGLSQRRKPSTGLQSGEKNLPSLIAPIGGARSVCGSAGANP